MNDDCTDDEMMVICEGCSAEVHFSDTGRCEVCEREGVCDQCVRHEDHAQAVRHEEE